MTLKVLFQRRRFIYFAMIVVVFSRIFVCQVEKIKFFYFVRPAQKFDFVQKMRDKCCLAMTGDENKQRNVIKNRRGIKKKGNDRRSCTILEK